MSGLIDAKPTVRHLRGLMAQGVSVEALSAKLGMHDTHIGDIARGRFKRVQRFTEECVLSVSIADFDVRPSARLDGTGTRRRIQALMACGWSARAIMDESGMHYTLIIRLLSGSSRQVLRANADKIARAYDRLWNVPPPLVTGDQRRNATKARLSAQRHGYAPPLAWDDDEIDNPKARPHTGRPHANRRVIVDEVAVERLKRGERVPVNKVEQRTAIAELAASGVRSKEIADRLGMGLSSAIRTRNRITAAGRKTA